MNWKLELSMLLVEGLTTGGDSSLTGMRIGRAEYKGNISDRRSKIMHNKSLDQRVIKVAAKMAKRAASTHKQPNKSKVAKFEFDRSLKAYYNEPTNKTAIWKKKISEGLQKTIRAYKAVGGDKERFNFADKLQSKLKAKDRPKEQNLQLKNARKIGLLSQAVGGTSRRFLSTKRKNKRYDQEAAKVSQRRQFLKSKKGILMLANAKNKGVIK